MNQMKNAMQGKLIMLQQSLLSFVSNRLPKAAGKEPRLILKEYHLLRSDIRVEYAGILEVEVQMYLI